PRHVILQKGDTIVTSGLTSVFPENIPVGVIEDFAISDGDAYYDIKVKVAVNFCTISHVHVLDYKNYHEQQVLERTN
ncbi:rod shape-determining protein MreC, partial [Paludibacteraceae bacterium OttesenSCG-928-F17]|nr:rod shape-determining protein MreC [Paludibacteraceae bacterium OttesenSCG-928-F17]